MLGDCDPKGSDGLVAQTLAGVLEEVKGLQCHLHFFVPGHAGAWGSERADRFSGLAN